MARVTFSAQLEPGLSPCPARTPPLAAAPEPFGSRGSHWLPWPLPTRLGPAPPELRVRVWVREAARQAVHLRGAAPPS